MKTIPQTTHWSGYTHLAYAAVIGLGLNALFNQQELIIVTFFAYPLVLLAYRKLKGS
jgi:hypothetical protein